MLVRTACDLPAEDRFRRWAGERLGEVDAMDGFDLVPEPTVERVIRSAELADRAHRVALGVAGDHGVQRLLDVPGERLCHPSKR